MNLENYLSASLPSSVVAKIFEENDDKEDSASPAKRQKLDLDDTRTETELLPKREEEEAKSEPEAEAADANDDSSTTTTTTTTEDDDVETNLIDILMNSFDASNPRELLSHMIPSYVQIPDNLDNYDICRLIFQMVAGEENLPKRQKLAHVNSIDHVIGLIRESKNIVILTGAGCSVSCGIPDFRSRNGIYARLHKDYPDLPDPQAMFDIRYFQHNPRPFFKFAKEIYPGQFKPSLSHLFIKKIEEKNKLLRNYTQNIDTIELSAGIGNIIQCHGSFATATCTNQDCKYKVNADDIRETIFNQEIPRCQTCAEVGILKPDIVFFGESLPESYHKAILEDKEKCDLLIVVGSSLKVRPVAHIPNMLKDDVPQILINRESLKHMSFDVELLGDCDAIVKELLLRLGEDWTTVNSDIKLNDDEKLALIESEKEIEEMISECENEQNSAESAEKTFLSCKLKEKTFLNIKPNVYVFHGAEISASAAKRLINNTECDSDDENTQSSTSTNNSDEEGEETSTLNDTSTENSSLLVEQAAKATTEAAENKDEL